MSGAGGLIVVLILWMIGLLILYYVIRLAVRHALADHARQVAAHRPDTGPGLAPTTGP
jgi:hypothetical protein